MHLRTYLAASVATLTLATATATPVFAQETTSAVAGQVTDEGGAAVAGAKVTVVHTPSGTRATAASDAGGNFSLRGLRVGGPYTVTVSAPGYADQTIEGIGLSVGDTFAIPVKLSGREIVVSADRVGVGSLATSSQSTFRSGAIQDIVSARRDIRDIVRRDLLSAYNPNVGGVTIAGGNIRTQRFSVDGVQVQDSFGLNYGGLPSTRGIISIEAIDQLTVKAAPFDISEGNFQGGAVNVVMKSGTNKVHVTAFGNFGGPSLTGDLTRDNRRIGLSDLAVNKSTILDFRNWGGSISGPIIKDTLFIAAAYEKLTEGAVNNFGVIGSGAPNVVPGLTQATVDDVIARFGNSGYDKYNIGTVPIAIPERDEKYSAKLDWNITEGHRLSLSYIHHENVLASFASGSASGSISATTPNISLLSNLYALGEKTNAYAGQLNSQWNDNLSSEVRVAYKKYRRGQDPYSGPDYAQLNVCTDAVSSALSAGASAITACGVGVPIVRLGPDTPRQANQFNSKQLTISTNLQLKAGAHTFKLAYDHVHSSLYNLFVLSGNGLAGTGGGSGLLYYDSLADFSARNANEYVLATTTTGNKYDGFVDWGYDVNTFGLQDTWKISDDFTVNAGLRFDMYSADKSIATNDNFVARYGFSNNATMNGRAKLQPRIGFNWRTTDTLRISGGFGLFAGGLSDVFMSNNYSNSGVGINSLGAAITSIDLLRTGPTSCIDRGNTANVIPTAVCVAALNGNTAGTVPQAVIDYVKATAKLNPLGVTNSLDPNFKIPAQYKVNLSANWRPEFGTSLLARGWSFRADMLYSKAQQAIRWIDLRSQPLVVGGVTQIAPDGRPRYGGLVNGAQPGTNYDIQLTNTTKGRAWVFAAGVQKELGDFNISASYTNQNVKDVAGALVSSTVSSSFGIPTSNPNSGGDYGRSPFEVRHTIRANLDFKHKFFGDLETRFNINWELRSGQPFSVTMNDFFTSGSGCNTIGGVNPGRGCAFGTPLNNSSHLFYVPDFNLTPTTNAAGQVTYGIVSFADAATLASVQNIVNNSALKKYQGKIAPKGVLRGPWYNKVDLNFAQQLPFFFGSKITALFSVENFLNLLNRNWGSYQDYGPSATLVRVGCTGATANGQTCPGYVYSAYSAPTTTTQAKASLYTIRAGVRFDF